MNAPRLAPALALDFPVAPDDARPAALPPVKQPRVWQRQQHTPGKLCDCAACLDSERRMVARAAEIDALLRRCP